MAKHQQAPVTMRTMAHRMERGGTAEDIPVVVFLTTRNRPHLLRQSLPQIAWQAAEIGARLVISDDRSTEEETLALLETVRVGSGAKILTNELGLDDDHPAFRVGYNFLFGLNFIMAHHPETELLLKVDDDIWMADGALPALVETYVSAAFDGIDILAASATCTTDQSVSELVDHSQERGKRRSYRLADGACSICALYHLRDWKHIASLGNDASTDILVSGWDCYYYGSFAPRYRQGAHSVVTEKNMVYHTGHVGTHVAGRNLNREFEYDLTGVVVDEGGMERWVELFMPPSGKFAEHNLLREVQIREGQKRKQAMETDE